ncbi:1909_t:CDS:2 [Rhizophagus irregularis]|nr:1909_t:CDS:2 [Rhizophagus irregularis]
MDGIEIEAENRVDEKNYVDDLESGNHTYGEKIDYVAVSPDGSIVATFNLYGTSISIAKVATNDKAKIHFDINTSKKPSNILGWSLAVSNIIDTENDTCLIAISCVTNKDTNPKEIEKDSSKDSATLICMNCVKIQKININLDKNISVSKEGTYLLPENLFKKLESFEYLKCSWKYLLKSRFQNYLMVDTSNHQKISIEIYDINNLQLVNVFYRHREENFFITNNNEPGIFAISTDSRLFVYSYGDKIITLYLMESGLEVVSKIFDNIYKIKFIEFIEKDKKLFIIEEDKEHDVKFHIWIISGCLNDYFSISKDDIGLSDSNISILSKYDEHHNTLTKANGRVIFYNKVDEKQFSIVHEVSIKRTTFGENDPVMTDEHEYQSCDLEPWNNNEKIIHGRFLNNDKRFLLLIGQNSIQLWKSKAINFMDFNNFKNFENSNLVYILISDKIKPETKVKFLIEDDITTVIIHACKSLVYLYNHKHVRSIEKYQKFVSGITNIIKDFIKRYPDNWKLMEVQYPLMSYLICSHSFSLIKYILFGVNGQTTEKLHKPQNDYASYPYYNDLELCDDLELNDIYLKSANDLTLALKFHQDRDSVMLAYLLEYYSENSMIHIGWMINVTNILPDLSKLSNHDYYGNYMDLLFYKPCFGEMKYNFPIKRFRALSVCQGTLKVFVPLINLISTNSSDFFSYNKMRGDILPDIYMVPFPNFTTRDTKIEGKSKKKGIVHFLRKTLFPPGYKNLEDKYLSPFLQINKSNEAFFTIPAIEAVINSRWYQAMAYWIGPLSLYTIFFILFASLPVFINNKTEMYKISEIIGFAIFYYIGIYLLMIEFMQIRKYKIKYITIFNIFNLSSIILGIIVFSLCVMFYAGFIVAIGEDINLILRSITTLTLWIELLLWLRIFSVIAINIFIFGNILKTIIPFFAFMFILIIAFAHSLHMMVPISLRKIEDYPFHTIWESILSMYFLNSISLSTYNYIPLKFFSFIANIIIVLVLINMIIALMNDTFNKAREDSNLGLLMYRTELIDDFERLDIPFNKFQLNDSPYICYLRDPDLMKKWMKKSQELRETKLYSWFKENVDEEIITYDGVDIISWYELISSNGDLTSDNMMSLWF